MQEGHKRTNLLTHTHTHTHTQIHTVSDVFVSTDARRAWYRNVIGSTMGAYPRGTGLNPVEGNGHFFPSCRQLYLRLSLMHTHTRAQTHAHTRTHTHTHTHAKTHTRADAHTRTHKHICMHKHTHTHKHKHTHTHIDLGPETGIHVDCNMCRIRNCFSFFLL